MPPNHYSDYIDSAPFLIDETEVDSYLASLEEADEWFIDLYSASMLTSEVNNGGFAQYFMSFAGIGATEAHEALIRIGMPELASITKEAMDRIPGGFVRDKVERTSRLMAMAGITDGDDSAFFKKKLFYDLDARFFASPEHGEFEVRMLAYAEEFGVYEDWE